MVGDKQDITSILAVVEAFKRAEWNRLQGEEMFAMNRAVAQLLSIKKRIEDDLAAPKPLGTAKPLKKEKKAKKENKNADAPK